MCFVLLVLSFHLVFNWSRQCSNGIPVSLWNYFTVKKNPDNCLFYFWVYYNLWYANIEVLMTHFIKITKCKWTNHKFPVHQNHKIKTKQDLIIATDKIDLTLRHTFFEAGWRKHFSKCYSFWTKLTEFPSN